jgi:Protein of unknown function (DUF1565)
MQHLTALVLAALAATATAQTEYWVDPTAGNNANAGTRNAPLSTFSYAASLAASNDTIFLLPGLYSAATNGEVFPIAFGTVPQNNLLIRGLGSVVLDLGGLLGGQACLKFAGGATGARLTNVTITNSDHSQWYTRAIESGTGANSGNAAMNVEIDRCRFVNINRGLILWVPDNVQGWRIHDNLFWNLTNDAILEFTSTSNNAIYNNTFHTNTFKAYVSDSTSSQCYNNLVVNCAIGFEASAVANNVARFQNNWLYNCPIVTQGSGFGTLPATNVVGIDPRLVNPTAGDFHLQASSPCIDAGNALIQARADLDGNSRIVDSDQNGSLLPEIGCYETTPMVLTGSFDPLTTLLRVGYTSGATSRAAFVLFSFDDGLVQVPGQGPILVSQARYFGYLFATGPNNWIIPLGSVPPFAPGTRIVMHVLGLGTTPALIGGNQVWITL